jgi:replicative DNA helicase
MTTISNALKNLALELEIPVIVLCQLNRQCDLRPDHHPHLSDFRDSGTLEQDCDIALMIYRGDCYEPDPGKHNNEAEIIVAKNRNGPTGTVRLTFRAPVMSFENMAHGEFPNE